MPLALKIINWGLLIMVLLFYEGAKQLIKQQQNSIMEQKMAGGTIITGGELVASNQFALGATTNIAISGGGVLDLGGFTQTETLITLNNGTVQDGTLTNTAINGVSARNSITAFIAGTSSVTNSGGTNTLTASNSYTGGTTITGGELIASNQFALGSTTNIAISGGGVLDLGGFTQMETLITLSNGTVQDGALTDTAINGIGGNNSVTAAITGTSSVTNSGGTNTLTASNSYTGGTFITGGELIASNQFALGAITGTTAISGGGVLDLGGFTQTQASMTFSNGTVQDGT